MPVPQFGEAPEGACPDRPAAFVVAERDGRIAAVQVPWRGRGMVLHLPGGGIDPGESARDAAIRECGEEAGLVFEAEPEPFVAADHYFLHHDGVVRNTRGQFFGGRIVGEDATLHVEADHELVWLEPLEAITRLDRGSHVWAVATWLRLRARAGAGSERP
jgi:8-oxo-dGTP diphosphatase